MIGRFSSNFIKYLAMGLAFALISFLFRSCDVKAESFTPSTGEILISSNSSRSVSLTGPSYTYGVDLFYYKNSDVSAQIYGIYAITANKFSGNYFQFIGATIGDQAPLGYVQLSDGNYVTCDSNYNTSANMWDFYGYTCSLPKNAGVYKYGMSYPSGTLYQGLQLSKLSYYADTSSEEQNKINETMVSIFNNISNVSNNVKDVENAVKDTNDTMKDDNIDTSSSSSFFNNFKSSDHGLTGIVSAPLKIINRFTTTTCKSVNIDFLGAKADLPCGSTLWGREDLKTFVDIYNVIMGGLISYGALKGIFSRVQDFKNPDNSKVEVIDL